jgi:Fe-S cluster assembly protein SufD
MGLEANFLNFKNKAAFDSLLEQGLPTRKDEAWKFTSLNEFKSRVWHSLDGTETHLSHEQMQELSKKLPSDFINFVFVNGVLNRTLSDDTDSFLTIEGVDPEDQSSAAHIEQRLLNLARAFLNKKVRLAVGKSRTIEKPVQILFVQSSKESVYGSELFDIVLEQNSELKLLVSTVSFINASSDASNLRLKVNVQKEARLSLIQLQNEDAGSFHFSQVEIEAAHSSQVTTFAMTLGNKLTRNYLNLRFTGANAEAHVYGLGVLDGDQHLDNYTFIQHETGHNQSVQHYKSILSGSSHSVFRGRVMIAPDAQKANSEQLNNNLLLTRTAQVETIPQLEIFADDVKAGHGATVGQLNKDEIFYFLSRGINQYEAVKMLSYGFAKELIYKIDNTDLQKYLLGELNNKLEKLVPNA